MSSSLCLRHEGGEWTLSAQQYEATTSADFRRDVNVRIGSERPSRRFAHISIVGNRNLSTTAAAHCDALISSHQDMTM